MNRQNSSRTPQNSFVANGQHFAMDILWDGKQFDIDAYDVFVADGKHFHVDNMIIG